MTPDLLAALTAFAFVSSITPGPNNLMLMASGATWGMRRTVPHMLGVALGFGVMVLLVGLGLAGVFEAWPPARDVLTAVSVAYLLWLAWRIARASAPGEGAAARGRPMSFAEAAAFQWVNPKAWTMALTAVTVYTPDRGLAGVTLVAAVFVAVNLPSVGSWAYAGQAMRRWLDRPARLRAFNVAMAALLIASVLPVVVA